MTTKKDAKALVKRAMADEYELTIQRLKDRIRGLENAALKNRHGKEVDMSWGRDEPGGLADKQRNYRNQIDQARGRLADTLVRIWPKLGNYRKPLSQAIGALSEFIKAHEARE